MFEDRGVRIPSASGEQTASAFRRLEDVGARVALTFDDCNFTQAWEEILDVLATYGVEATFFCSGAIAVAEPRLARRTVDDGHTVGSHGWDHVAFARLTQEDVRWRLGEDERAWREVAGAELAPYFRPPYGSYDGSTLVAAATAGFSRVVLWDVDPRDWTRPGPHAIADHVVARARPGSIVILHVIDQTAAALPSIIEHLRDVDLTPTSVPNLFAAAAAAEHG